MARQDLDVEYPKMAKKEAEQFASLINKWQKCEETMQERENVNRDAYIDSGRRHVQWEIGKLKEGGKNRSGKQICEYILIYYILRFGGVTVEETRREPGGD